MDLRRLHFLISAKSAEISGIFYIIGMKKYIHEHSDYPKFTWDKDAIFKVLLDIVARQNRILGKMQQLGFGTQQETMLNALTEEITKSSEIEGEILNSEQVRSSLAKWLDVNLTKEVPASHHIEGIVNAFMDAIRGFKEPLTESRLFMRTEYFKHAV